MQLHITLRLITNAAEQFPPATLNYRGPAAQGPIATDRGDISVRQLSFTRLFFVDLKQYEPCFDHGDPSTKASCGRQQHPVQHSTGAQLTLTDTNVWLLEHVPPFCPSVAVAVAVAVPSSVPVRLSVDFLICAEQSKPIDLEEKCPRVEAQRGPTSDGRRYNAVTRLTSPLNVTTPYAPLSRKCSKRHFACLHPRSVAS